MKTTKFLVSLVLFFLVLFFSVISTAEESKVEVKWEGNSLVVLGVVDRESNTPNIPHFVDPKKAFSLLRGKIDKIILEEKRKTYYSFSFPLKKTKVIIQKNGGIENKRWQEKTVIVSLLEKNKSDWFNTILMFIFSPIIIFLFTIKNREAWKRLVICAGISFTIFIAASLTEDTFVNSLLFVVIPLFIGALIGGIIDESFHFTAFGALTLIIIGIATKNFIPSQGWMNPYVFFIVIIYCASLILSEIITNIFLKKIKK